MLFYVILGVILVASIACAFLTKEKGEKDKRAKVIKRTGMVVAVLTFVGIVILSIAVIGCQANTTEESLEMERVYLIYKVQNNEYNSSTVKRIEQYNDGIKDAQKYIKNPFIGIFYTKAETEAEPIRYEITIIDDEQNKKPEKGNDKVTPSPLPDGDFPEQDTKPNTDILLGSNE